MAEQHCSGQSMCPGLSAPPSRPLPETPGHSGGGKAVFWAKLHCT